VNRQAARRGILYVKSVEQPSLTVRDEHKNIVVIHLIFTRFRPYLTPPRFRSLTNGNKQRSQVMKSGLLWFDNSPAKSITEKIADAARRYQEKFGIPPNRCFVNPNELGDVKSVGDIVVASKQTILANHVWLGVAQ
jgi:hypothetical protein